MRLIAGEGKHGFHWWSLVRRVGDPLAYAPGELLLVAADRVQRKRFLERTQGNTRPGVPAAQRAAKSTRCGFKEWARA